MPGLSGMASKNCFNAGIPPADAPIATNGILRLLGNVGPRVDSLEVGFFDADFNLRLAIARVSRPHACCAAQGYHRTVTPWTVLLYSLIGAVRRPLLGLRNGVLSGVFRGEIGQLVERRGDLEKLEFQRDIIRRLRMRPKLFGATPVV